VRTNLLLGTAAVGLLITGAIAQTSSSIDRIKDPAGHQNATRDAEAKKNVRTVYPNTQNAEQAIQQSKNAQGGADASKRQPGDVTPLSSAQQQSSPLSKSPAQPAQSTQQNTPASATQQSATEQSASQQSAPPAATQQTPPTATQQTPATPSTTATPAASQPAPVQTAQPSPQPTPPSNAAPPPDQQSAPTATAQQSTPSEPPVAQPNNQGSTGLVALNTEQQTSIGQTIARHNVKAITNVNFSIAVGTKVPTSVQLRALPSDLVTFVPQYRGYSYFVVEEQVMIVDPGTHEIVAIVPYTAAAPELTTRTVQAEKPRTPAAEKPVAQKPVAQKPVAQKLVGQKRVAEKPMITRSVNLNTEHKPEPRRPAIEERKTTRSVVRRDYREERTPRTVTVEEYAESAPVPVQRGPRFFDDDDEGPRPGGFFGFFR